MNLSMLNSKAPATIRWCGFSSISRTAYPSRIASWSVEQVGTVLDVEDLIPFSYTLEVSSPGLDRKLVKESDYTRFEGKLARIQTRIPLHHQKSFQRKTQRFSGRQDHPLELAEGRHARNSAGRRQGARLEFDWADEKYGQSDAR